MIALIDYGAGNLTSVRKGFAAAGADLFTPSGADELRLATAIVVPGVGHFAATSALDHDWRHAIRQALDRGALLFGICLGQQWLFDGSDEAPGVPGLGLIRGRCRRLPPTLKVPHVGWNSLEMRKPSQLLAGIAHGTQAYFTHSYAAEVTDAAVATTTHSATFAAVVETPQLFGVQFHPEKSGPSGVQMLKNFVSLCSRNV
ncbi:MAG: imidazole glycerol phosphate synthase subunit HisH [Vicinamibacterales bacterium]